MAGNLTFGMMLTVVDKATAPLRAVRSAFAGVSEAGKKLQALSQTLHDARENVQDFAQRGQAALQSIIAPSNDVSESLAKVQTVVTPLSGTMTDALGRIKGAATDWAATHRDSASSFVDTTYMMISAGLDEAKAVAATSTAMRVARATMGDATVAANLIGGAYNTMGDKTQDAASELARLGDVVTKTQQTFQFADMAQLAEGLKNATATALQTGVSFEQLNTVVGQLNSSQLQGAMAGTSLKAAMANMQRASTDVGFAMARTSTGGLDLIGTIGNIEKKYGSLAGMSPELVQSFRTAFGDEGWTAISLMIGKSQELTSNLQKVQQSAGAAAQATAIMESTRPAQAEIMSHQVDELKMTLADGLLPVLTQAMPVVSELIRELGGFAKAHPGLVAIVGTMALLMVGTASVVAPILSAVSAAVSLAGVAATAAGSIGTAATAAWAWTAALLANPITWIVAAVIAAVALIYIYWEPISGFFIKLWDQIKGAFAAAWDFVVGVWSQVTGWFKGLFGEVTGAFRESFVRGLWKLFTLLSPLAWVVKAFAAIAPYLAGLWSRIVSGVWSGLKAAGSAVVSVFSAVWTSIKDAFGAGLLQGLARLFQLFSPVGWIMAAFGAVSEYLTGLSLSELGSRILQSLLDGLVSVGSGILGFVSSLASTVLGAIASVGQTLWSGISADLSRVWGVLSSFSLAAAGAKIIGSLVDGIRSAAAGPVEAVRGVVQKVRNLLPFSPAKEGPLRDLHRVRLVETLASAVRPDPLVRAMRGAAGAAMAAMTVAPTLATPAMAPIPSYVSSASSRTETRESLQMNVTIQLGGADSSRSAVAELEAWIRDPSNARMLARAVRAHAAREARTELT